MKNIIIVILLILTLIFIIKINSNSTQVENTNSNQHNNFSIINPEGQTVKERFNLPEGFERITVEINSFEYYLRHLPLKPDSSQVLYFDGRSKYNNNIYLAVIDKPIGKYDLHQCADAVMHLYADYLWRNKSYNKIHFNLTNGFEVDYKSWKSGKRVNVEGNKTAWINAKSPSNTYQNFWAYLEFIFMYAGTASLSKELKTVKWYDLKIGDILIQGGFPGHAVIAVDMAINKTTQEKIYMLAQSFMPAQETQILCNPKLTHSPWYSTRDSLVISTPEWEFNGSDLMRF